MFVDLRNQGAHDRFEEGITKTEKRVGVIEKKLI